MIQQGTRLIVADNTGAKVVECIKILGGTKRRFGQIGDLIIASVKIAEPRGLVKKKEVVKCVIARQCRPYRRPDGSYVKFDDNAAIILEEVEPKGTRIFGPVARELKEKGFTRIVSLAPEVL